MFVERVVQMNRIELHLEKPLGQRTSDCDLVCRMLSMGRWLGLLVELSLELGLDGRGHGHGLRPGKPEKNWLPGDGDAPGRVSNERGL